MNLIRHTSESKNDNTLKVSLEISAGKLTQKGLYPT